MPEFKVYLMNVFEGLKQIEANSIDTVITSPPYWGLRDYKVEGQLGLEEHPQQYIDKIVSVFEEIKRVLKPSGSVWLNLGDTYYGSNSGMGAVVDNTTISAGSGQDLGMPEKSVRTGNFDGKWLQPKQRLLMPHRIAIAMQGGGWILRNDVCWHKPSHMPSSVRDRLTNSFEYIFHFVKQQRYYYDLDAIREPHKTGLGSQGIVTTKRFGGNAQATSSVSGLGEREVFNNPYGKNPADVWQYQGGTKEGEYFGQPTKNYKEEGNQDASEVKCRILKGFNPNGVHPSDFWEINPEPYREAHFACFPTELVRRPLLATCPKQVCVKCEKARERISEGHSAYKMNIRVRDVSKERIKSQMHKATEKEVKNYKEEIIEPTRKTIGWTIPCSCNANFKAGTVLDPFLGSGTTLQVSQELGLNGIGIELQSNYAILIMRRLNCKTKIDRNKFSNPISTLEFISEKEVSYEPKKVKNFDAKQATI